MTHTPEVYVSIRRGGYQNRVGFTELKGGDLTFIRDQKIVELSGVKVPDRYVPVAASTYKNG